MAQFAIEIPDADLPRVIGAFASEYGYQAEIPNAETQEMEPNPQSASKFANEAVRNYIKEVVRAAETRQAIEAARAAAAQADLPDITDPN